MRRARGQRVPLSGWSPARRNPLPDECAGPVAMSVSVVVPRQVARTSRYGLTSTRRRSLGAMVIVSALLLLGMAGSWSGPVQSMDEGIVLEYPQLMLQGQVPFRDFQSSYGPGAYLPLAAAYDALGPSVTVERAVGVAYRLATVLAIVALLLALGPGLATAGGSLAALGVVGTGGVPVAYAWYFALACVLWGLWCARAAITERRPRIAGLLWIVSGLLAGAAASARPELGVAAILSSSVLFLGAGRRAITTFAIGLVAGASPLVWNLVAAGWSSVWSYGVVARMHQLPMSGYTFAAGAGYLAVVSATTLVVVVAAIRERRRIGATPVTRCWLALALLSVLMVPQLLQRTDITHFSFVAPVCLGLLPWAVLRGPRTRLARAAIPVLCAAMIGLSAAAASANKGYEVHNDGRNFAATSAASASDQQRTLDWIDTHVAPGRRLFVGPADLTWAFYTPTELYFLTPALRPSGFYLELGPGDDTPMFTRGLIDSLHRADVLLLERLVLPDWRAQLPYARAGSTTPNAVVRRDFHAVFKAGPYSVWLRRLPHRSPSR
jgi:hypothetical protein